MTVSVRRCLKVFSAFAPLLLLASCFPFLSGIGGPFTVSGGSMASYDIHLVGADGANAAAYVYIDVPDGWDLISSTYQGTVNGVDYTGEVPTQLAPTEGPCGAEPQPPAGYHRLAFVSQTFPVTTASDNGFLTVNFAIGGGTGTFTISAMAGGIACGTELKASNPVEVVGDPIAPTPAKSFSPSSIAPGETSTLTITLQNPNDTALTAIDFIDTYPAGVVNAAIPNATTTCAGGAVTGAAGANSIALSGASLPGQSACTMTIDVTAAAPGTYDNVIPLGAISTNEFTRPNPASNTATLTVTAAALVAPTVAKAFAPASIVEDTTSTLTVTLTNANAEAVTGVAFTDGYPAGLVNAPAPNAATTCGGVVTAAAGGASLAISGATIPASGSCTVSVDVTAATPGSYANAIPAGSVTSTNAPANAAASNTATLDVTAAPLAAPTVAKAFAPASIVEDSTSRLTITLSNANAEAITGVAFTDGYPAGLVNAPAPNAATTCGGVVTAAAGGASLAISGATIPASGSCTVSVDVTAATAGSYANALPAGSVTSTNAPANAAASNTATLNVAAAALAAPTVAKAFAPTAIVVGGTTRLTITLVNPNATAITGAAFADSYPAGLVNASPANAATTCGGTVLATAGAASLSLSGGTIPANGNCTVSADVTATTTGSFINELAAGAVTSANAPPNATGAASAPVIVSAAPAPADVAGVPTLNEWALILLAAALGLIALRATRT